MANVEWLLHEAMGTRAIPEQTLMEIDDDAWKARIERVELGPGLKVFLTTAKAHDDVTLQARDSRTDQWMGSQVTITGRAEIDCLDGERALSTPESALLFRFSRREASYRLCRGDAYHSVGFTLDIERVKRLFDGEAPPPLLPLLCPAVDVSRVLAVAGSRAMRRIAASMFGRGLNGPLRNLMMEGAVLQLLAAQAAAAMPPRPKVAAATLSPREHDALRAARERLLIDMRNPPSLGELAQAVGLTEKRLNAGFRKVFGATVFETLRNERLEHARLVLTREDILLKDVAHRVGYNHVTNFINAFTARFGAPPRKHQDSASTGERDRMSRPADCVETRN